MSGIVQILFTELSIAQIYVKNKKEMRKRLREYNYNLIEVLL